MLKRIIAPTPARSAAAKDGWLDLETLAEIEISSEDAENPIEAALLPGHETPGGSGWRAGGPGQQTIRIIFLKPQALRHIRLQFSERQSERTQMYLLRWSPDDGRSFHELVRQQWNFSPNGGAVEVEDHYVNLAAVTRLELIITPDISDTQEITTIASMDYLRLA